MRIFEVAWPGNGRLAVVSRPSGESLDIEMAVLRAAGLDVLVSMLENDEAAQLGLAGEREFAERHGLAFETIPTLDFSLPEPDAFRQALFALHDRYREGAFIAAHCRGSVGRAPLLIASLLVLDGALPEHAWRLVSEARGVPVPDTDAQRKWIFSLSARLPLASEPPIVNRES